MAATSPRLGRGPTPPVFPALQRAALTTLQVNLGYRCNQACHHCHVDAGPLRTEEMTAETASLALSFALAAGVSTLDITGGAPELNGCFRPLVRAARAAGLRVIDRCNLTILEEPGQADLANFLAQEQVHVVASLPCYGPENVDIQRGKGVFEKSIRALRTLNGLGYGIHENGLTLDLVYNPLGPSLPPPQASLEATYRTALAASYGVYFNRLLTLANMPIARFRHALERDGHYADYLHLLVANHREENLANVMCRSLLSVDWRGYVYDCDFNQMLGMPAGETGAPRHLSSLLAGTLTGQPIAVGTHCFGCTAGHGSSCGGALSRA
ncbi:MAG: radical SAM/Cys-rich domain protein [Gammaproteobacteria bacterium]|nr:radical SAM/Cys-rich domain protein [Gammaproteobacteria bacterium]